MQLNKLHFLNESPMDPFFLSCTRLNGNGNYVEAISIHHIVCCNPHENYQPLPSWYFHDATSMGNLQNLNNNGNVDERTKRKKHKCDFKAHIATIKFHFNIIKFLVMVGSLQLWNFQTKREKDLNAWSFWWHHAREHWAHQWWFHPPSHQFTFHKSIDGGHFHAHFCSGEKKTLMNLRGGVDKPTTIVGLLGDGVATLRFCFQISKVGGLEIFQKKT